METPNEVIVRYLQDCEAAERNFEDALGTFAVTGEQNEVKRMFEMATQRARSQHQRLEARLRELGAEPSTLKSILAHILAFAPTSAQLGHEPAEKNTQHLMVCIAAASAEMAMYESLATAARLGGRRKNRAPGTRVTGRRERRLRQILEFAPAERPGIVPDRRSASRVGLTRFCETNRLRPHFGFVSQFL